MWWQHRRSSPLVRKREDDDGATGLSLGAVGGGEKDEIWLCSDGSFRHVDHAYGDAGVYHREQFGRWRATGVGDDETLVLGYDDGSTRRSG